MFHFLPSLLRGVIATLLLVLNTLVWCALLFVFAMVKLILPFAPVRKVIDPMLNAIASCWIACNSGWMWLTQRTRWNVAGVDSLRYEDWYLVNCNHQSWVDIFVLQHLLNRRIPLLKFFLKQELIYVPVIGLAWWALDFPFLKRQNKADLRKNPAQRDADRNAARRACAKFALVPTSVMSFAEGTRFTAEKHQAQHSPYQHLLKPKAGALAMALDAMGDSFHSLVDATIVYPQGIPSFWDFLCGNTPEITVRVQQVVIPPEFSAGDYVGDSAYRKRFHRWLEALWKAKDEQITALVAASASERA